MVLLMRNPSLGRQELKILFLIPVYFVEDKEAVFILQAVPSVRLSGGQ